MQKNLKKSIIISIVLLLVIGLFSFEAILKGQKLAIIAESINKVRRDRQSNLQNIAYLSETPTNVLNIEQGKSFTVEENSRITATVHNAGNLTVFGTVEYIESNTGTLIVAGRVNRILSHTGVLKVEKGAVVTLVDASIYAKIYNAGTLYILGEISNLQGIMNLGQIYFCKENEH